MANLKIITLSVDLAQLSSNSSVNSTTLQEQSVVSTAVLAGPTGQTGPTGPAGPGVPSGGTTGMALFKNSGTNFDALWRLIAAADIPDFDTQVRANRVDQLALPTGNLDLNNRRIIDLADPVSAQDAATRAYVDAAAVGLSIKPSVNYATAAALPANSYASNVITASSNGALSVDGQTPSVNDRILVKDESSALKNGIYTVTQVGSGGTPFILTRAADMDLGSEVPGTFCFVQSGTANAGRGYVVIGAGPYTLGTTEIIFTQFSAQATPGNGPLAISLTGGTSADALGITIDTSYALQSAIYARNATNFAQAGDFVKYKLFNATDSARLLRLENAGSGKTISATDGTNETFSLTPAGALDATSLTLDTPMGLASGGTGAATAGAARTNLGLGNVDNTSDANKPVSIAQQTALDGKQPLDSDLTDLAAIAPTNDDIIQRKAGVWTNRTPAQLKSDLGLTSSDVGLGNVPNVNATQRANHTGTQLASTISDFDTQVRTNRLDQMAAPTASVSMNSQLITNVLNPVSDQDAVTKAYADSLANGLTVKTPARVASTANINLSSPGAAIDGVTLSSGDRVLAKNQTTASQNGIWIFNGASSAMTRALDANTSAKVKAGMYVFVNEGTANADTAWVLTTNDTIVLDTTSLTFANFSITSLPDASALVKGKIQLAGDLGGTAASPKVRGADVLYVAPYGSSFVADYYVQDSQNAQIAINQALAAAAAKPGGGVVELLGGTFVCGAPVIPLNYTWLRGQGMWGQTILTTKANAQFAILDNYDEYPALANPWTFGIVSDMELDGSNIDRTKSHKCFNSASARKCQLLRLYAHDSTATGIGTDDFIYGVIDGCFVQNCGFVNQKTITAASWASNAITFTTSVAHGYSPGDVVVVHDMVPPYYNGKFVISSTPTSTTFLVDYADNSGSLNLNIDPGTATIFGTSSDSLIGHNGIGVASGAPATEATIVSNCICVGNQNNNFLIEADQNFTGPNAAYIYTNCISINAGNYGYLNTGTPNSQFNDCFDYGSPTGFSAASTTQTRTITAASWSGGIATFTTSTAHNYSATGAPDGVLKKVEIDGMTPSGYNGYYTVLSTPTSTTFTVAIAADPGTATVFGTSTYVFHNVYDSSFNDCISTNNLNWGMRLPTHSDGVMIKDSTIKYSYNRGIQINSSKTQLSGLRIKESGRQGILIATGSGNIVPMKHVDISDTMIWNSGKRGVMGNGNGVEIAPAASGPATIENVTINNLQAWDDQDTKTQNYGIKMTSGGTVRNVHISGGDLNGNSIAPILLQDTSDQIRISNVGGINPTGKVLLGNVSGSVTFDNTTGNYFNMTLTGNITPVMPASLVTGALMTTVFTQDGTGSRTITVPANAAVASGTSLVLSTAASAVDSVTWVAVNESTIKWREVSRAMGRRLSIAEGGTGQGTATTAFNALSPMTTAGDIIYGGTSGAGTRLAAGTSSQVLIGGTTPAWNAVNLASMVTGTLPLANGGTGQTTANAGLNALLPTQTSNSGKFLTTDGTNTSWGTVTATSAQSLVDSNSNNSLTTVATASAVSYLQLTNAASGGTITLAATASAGTPNFILKGSGTFALRPTTNGTNAIRLQDSAGTGNILVADATNIRVGIGKTTPTMTLDVSGLVGLLAGTSTTIAKAGGTIFTHFADAGNTTTSETDLYSDSIPANALGTNGDSLEAAYGCIFVNSTSTKQVKVYFGGTAIFDTGALTISSSSEISMEVKIIRVSSSVVRYIIYANTTGASTGAYSSVGELTGLTLSNANTLKITGTAAGVEAATNDIVAKAATVEWKSTA